VSRAIPKPLDAEVQLLTEVLYADLQRLAHRVRMRSGTPSETLRTTALVHEAYLKLARHGGFRDRSHFLATTALAMRQVLTTHARRRLAEKRGGGQQPVPLEQVEGILAVSEERIVALDDALQDLERDHPRLVRVIECRYYAGYSEPETAEALGVTDRTVQRDWVKAKALLYEALGSE
jgi:RNA polymerase sigma factor (TIGR02999 family)